jgi:hypothetical protein
MISFFDADFFFVLLLHCVALRWTPCAQGGFGLERSEQKAHEYFMLAAEQGEVRGLAAKGRALLYGIQVCCCCRLREG